MCYCSSGNANDIRTLMEGIDRIWFSPYITRADNAWKTIYAPGKPLCYCSGVIFLFNWPRIDIPAGKMYKINLFILKYFC